MAGAYFRRIRVLGVALLLTVLFSGMITPAYAYVFILKWGSYGSGDGQFKFPGGVAVDGAGNVYVVDYYNHRVQKFDGSGVFITKWGSEGSGDGQFKWPFGVAVDSAGNVYVADNENERVQKFTSSGVYITQWGSYGSGDGQFKNPDGVAVDSAGNVYVVDVFNNRVQKFTSSGVFITKWGSQGSGDGQFYSPKGVAVDSAGNVYVTDGQWNHRVQKFTSSGVFITKWGSQGSGDGQFSYPRGVAVDSAGNVYVTDSWNDRVQKFDGSGGFITKWGSYGSGDGQFSHPDGVAVDSAGNVYVTDGGNHRVQKFELGPAYTLTITATPGGTTSPSPGSYEYASGAVAVVSATHDIGYIFDHWELDGNDVGSTNPISVIMTANLTLHAVFSWVGTYNLMITTTTGGTTNPTPGIHTYTAEAVAVVSATHDIGYIFDHWELDGNDVGSTNPISVTMNTDHPLHAVFVYTGPPSVPEYPGADISIVAATFAFLAAFYFTLKRKKQPPSTTSVTRPSKA